jgi:hypothetical protein
VSSELRRPFHFEIALCIATILKVQVNQRLVRNASLLGFFFELLDNLRVQPKCNLLLKLARVRIFARLHF